MRTLVIHPDDITTDFLKIVYEGKGYTVINDRKLCLDKKFITEQIKEHDRIMMMGHGYPGGLFYTCINSSMVYLLREKDCVCIWCNADKFVLKYGLKGFYTGMFISEVGEAFYYGIKIDQEKIDYSNNLFVENLKNVIESPNILTEIKELYNGDCPVIQFNNARLYMRDEESILAESDFKDELVCIADCLNCNCIADCLSDYSDDDNNLERLGDFWDEDDIDPAGGRGLHSHE